MRGKYTINNKLYIKNILSEMTLVERQKLLLNDFDTLWYQLWGDFVGNQFRSEEKNARDKFDALKLGLHHYSLDTLIKDIETTWQEPEWGFPKGRHNNLEKDLNCGLREFEEETGYPTHSVKVIQNLIPYEEIFTGSNYKSYKHKYYVGQIEFRQQPSKQFQKNEISKTEWCTYEKALQLIRPYNLEKLAVLEKVNRLLNSYTAF
jgi:8-oxo-dGTP pyrophosphatase MutT (NUDIX family)